MHFSGWPRRASRAGRAAALVLALLAPTTASAATRAAELVAADGGAALEIRDGRAVLARFSPVTPPLRRGTPTLHDVTVDDHRVLVVRIPVRGTPGVETWIGEPGTGTRAARVVWTGIDGPRDGDGETAVHVEVDGEQIREYQTAAAVTRCDGRPPQLFPRSWDFSSARFRPVVSPLPAPAPHKLVARREDPSMPAGRSRGVFRWTSASTTAAEGRDARGLTAPTALGDGDATTVWTESLGGDGRGEFLTARSTAGAPRVRGLRIIPGDASSVTALRGRNRVRRFQLALGPAPEQRFDVELADDPGASANAGERGRQPYWVALPQPMPAACLTVVLTDVYPGTQAAPPRAFGTTAIAELDVFTELDQPEGVAQLVAQVAAGDDCGNQASLLVALGAEAVLPMARALVGASADGRACLIDALSRQPDSSTQTPEVLDALVIGLGTATPAEEQQIGAVFQRTAAPPIPALRALLTGPAAADAQARAARALGGLHDAAAVTALLAAAGTGPDAVRGAVVSALMRSPVLTADAFWPALESASAGKPPAPAADLLSVLPAVVARQPDAAARALPLLRATVAPPLPFEVRGRAVMALGALRTADAVPILADVRATSDEPVLRYLAARELASARSATATVALRAALQDQDPRVRETAALGLGDRHDAGARDALIAGAKQEPWPSVRQAELQALGRLCGPGAGDLMIRAIQKDVDQVRRASVVGLGRCHDPRAREMMFRILGRVAEPVAMRALAARTLGDLGDPGAAPQLAAFLQRLVTESDTDLGVEGVTLVALRALAQLGGPAATQAAAELALDRRHAAFRLPAVQSLGTLCDRAAGAAALQTVADGDGPTALKDAARAAAAHCGTAAP